MSKIDRNIRILWISDIHYFSHYNKKNHSFKEFINSFVEYADELDKNEKFDYILITGDIANSGIKEQYDLFKEDILFPLQEKIENATLLVVPGNHDVNRNSDGFIESFFRTLPKERDTFFRNNYNKYFKDLFKDYSEAFKTNPKLPSKDVSDLSDNSALFGYVIDKKKKTIFILLNSAWFSIERNLVNEYISKKIVVTNFFKYFKNLYLHYIKKEKSIVEDNIMKSIRFAASEYGRQSLGLNFLNTGTLEEKVDDFNDYIVVTIMHHPINWLGWNSRIVKLNNDRELSTFHKIRKNTDLLLTGHEHIPKTHLSEKIDYNNLLHIQAGCFLTYQKEDEFNVKDFWFSTLSINTAKRTVLQEKHSYTTKKIWELEPGDNVPIKFDKKYKSYLSNNRFNNIARLSLDYKKVVFHYNQDNENQTLVIDDVTSLNKNFFVFNKILHTFTLSRKIDSIDLSYLKGVIDDNDIEIVCFYFLDRDHEFFPLYKNNVDKMLVLGKIKENFDFKFNEFRLRFFNDLKGNEPEMYKSLKFINKILPYWEIESFELS